MSILNGVECIYHEKMWSRHGTGETGNGANSSTVHKSTIMIHTSDMVELLLLYCITTCGSASTVPYSSETLAILLVCFYDVYILQHTQNGNCWKKDSWFPQPQENPRLHFTHIIFHHFVSLESFLYWYREQLPRHSCIAPFWNKSDSRSDRGFVSPSTRSFATKTEEPMVKRSEKLKKAIKELYGKVYNLGIVGFSFSFSRSRMLCSMGSSPSWCISVLLRRTSPCTSWCSPSSKLDSAVYSFQCRLLLQCLFQIARLVPPLRGSHNECHSLFRPGGEFSGSGEWKGDSV